MDQLERLAELEEALGYSFRDRALLAHALTHSSWKPELRCSNERLEFLGDAILGAAVSDYLYRNFPDHSEGDLTRIKSLVVSRVALAHKAHDMDLAGYLRVAKGVATSEPEPFADENGGLEIRHRRALPPSILADAVEAIIAAVYLDGGTQAAYDFVLRHMQDILKHACEKSPAHNFKSVLQEYVQRNLNKSLVYNVTAETGPDHVKSFDVVAMIGGKPYASGRGATKKAAEQMAAELTLIKLGQVSQQERKGGN